MTDLSPVIIYPLLFGIMAALFLLAHALFSILHLLRSGVLKGERGPAGDDGHDGIDGLDGTDGKDGIDAQPVPSAPPAPPVVHHQPSIAPNAHGLVRIKQWDGFEWVLGPFVRQNTPAWQRAYDEDRIITGDDLNSLSTGSTIGTTFGETIPSE